MCSVVEQKSIVPVFAPVHKQRFERSIFGQRGQAGNILCQGTEKTACWMLGIVVCELLMLKEPKTTAWKLGENVEYRISIACVSKILQATEGVVFEGLRCGVVAKKQCYIKLWSYV